MKAFNSAIFKIILALAIGATAHAQTASILPNAKTTFNDQNGNPLSGGKVYFYEPGTTTPKQTWQDIGETITNTNPVLLDSAGRAIIWGDGKYRQQVFDKFNNLQWDQVTASAGASTSGTTLGDGLSVGTILPTSDIIAPANYQFAYGQAVSRTTYPELLAAISVSTPIGCVGGSPIINVSDTSYISVGTVLESICATGSPTVISKTSTTITLSVNSTITVSTNGRLFPYGNGDASTTFNLPDMRGYIAAGRCNMGGIDCVNLNSTYFSSNASNTPSGLYAKGGVQSKALATANLPPYTPTGTVSQATTPSIQTRDCCSGSGSGVAGQVGLGNNTQSPTAAIGITISAQTITMAAQGGTSTPFSLVQPTITLNYIIKVTPDVNLTSTYGVAAIGGMTGVIACGANVTCAGNTISVNSSSVVNSIQGMTGNITCGAGLLCSANTISSTSVNYIVPSDYGAVCDGVTNDAVALQNAINAAAGKALFIPSGKTCVTNAVLTVSANTVITGAGRDISAIKSTITNRGAIFYAFKQSNITIENLNLIGTRSVSAWTLASFGAISVELDNTATQEYGNYIFRNLKLSGFNSTYWIALSTGNSSFDISGVVMDNIQFDTNTLDIPTDPTPANNQNYAIVSYGGTTGAAVNKLSIRNLVINGAALCYGVGMYNTHIGHSVTDNKILNVGTTNVAAHCTNGIGFTNSYGIFNYDISGTGFPSKNGLIARNYILNPYSSGIYTVGAQNATLAYNDYNTLIAENVIVGQSQSDLPIRGAIVLNNLTNSTISDNKVYNNWAGIVVSGQYLGQVDVKSNHCVTNVSGGSCISIAGASGTTGNVPSHTILNNTLQASGTSSQIVKLTNDNTHYLGSIDFSNNKISGDVTGANFSGLFINGRLAVNNNVFSGIASVSMLDVSSVTGGPTVLQNNTFDLLLSTAGIGLKTTNSLIYLNGAVFMNRNSGTAFAFSGVGSTGTVKNVMFSNVATANQIVASSIGLAIPTWSAANQDFVQNLNASVSGNFLTVGWLNTANGVNWQASNTTNGLTIGSLTDYYAATSGKLLVASAVYPTETTTTFGATTTFDFNTFINTAVTLTANITTQTLSNVRAGKSGTISFIQDATGSRTTVWNSIFKFSGGTTPTLTTTANAVDVLTYSCRSATFCVASLSKDVK